VSGGIESDQVRTRITPEAGFGEKLPQARRFMFGYSREGEFQVVGHQNQLTKSDVIHQKYPQMADTHLYSDKSDMYLRDDQGQLYDVTPRWQYDQQHSRFDEDAREVVFQAQSYGSETAHRTDKPNDQP